MLIDLHAHAPHPDYYNQHPHWGPFFEQHQDGDIKLRVGDWILGLGSPERKAAVRAGNGPKLETYLARWADPKTRLAGMDTAERRSEAERLMLRVGLADWGDVPTKKFSKGMMQRLGLAQALMGNPALVVLDEPTDGVDPIGRREIREILSWLRDQGTTVFLNSHLLSEVEMICTRVAVLDKGLLVREGTIQELTAAPLGYDVVGSRIEALPDDVIVMNETEPTKYQVQAASPEALSEKLRAMMDAGMTVQEVTPVRRSLEQAFMDIIGEGAS